MYFRQVFEPKLAQYTYIIGCQKTGSAIVVDPMRDIQRYVDIASQNGLTIEAVTDTHIHADYLSGSRQFAHEHGVKVYASDEGAPDWRFEWLLGSEFDYQLLKHGDVFSVGNVEFKVIHTPGHTPEHICFIVTDTGAGADDPMGALTGDFVFVGDVGRPDLLESAAGQVGAMEPSARSLGKSLQGFKNLGSHLQVWPGHGAGSACGKSLGAVPMSTVGYELSHNEAIRRSENIDDFVEYILTGQPEPPLYFARMKRDNRGGPPIFEQRSNPQEYSIEELLKRQKEPRVAIVDTRAWREYQNGHIPGSLCAPLNSVFNTVVGCYVEDDQPIILICEEQQLSVATLDLMRIGLDNVIAFCTPRELEEYRSSAGELATIPSIEFDQLQERMNDENTFVLDVRRAAELDEVGAIPNAHNIAHTRLRERLDEVPRDKEVIVSCLSGSRSAYAAGLLDSNGYRVTWFGSGFVGWQSAGGEIVKHVDHNHVSA